jgi:hypothetical protein
MPRVQRGRSAPRRATARAACELALMARLVKTTVKTTASTAQANASRGWSAWRPPSGGSETRVAMRMGRATERNDHRKLGRDGYTLDRPADSDRLIPGASLGSTGLPSRRVGPCKSNAGHRTLRAVGWLRLARSRIRACLRVSRRIGGRLGNCLRRRCHVARPRGIRPATDEHEDSGEDPRCWLS